MAQISAPSFGLMVCLALLSSTRLQAQPEKKHLQIVGPDTVLPSFPLGTIRTKPCRLDLSDELFGGVKEACTGNLDRSRCCPVLAAWLYAAHARSSLEVDTPPTANDDLLPTMPEDSQSCIDSLRNSLDARRITIPSPNQTCDTIDCFCAIRLHKIGSLSCPAAFILSRNRTVSPTSVVRDLQRSCSNSSYSGCTNCLRALQKVNRHGKNTTWSGNGDSRTKRMMERDCKLMGLTWLLAKNKTAYIPTVSAALRAMMYNTHGQEEGRCSRDQDNMPLAADSAVLDAPDAAVATLRSSQTCGFLVLLVLHVLQWLRA